MADETAPLSGPFAPGFTDDPYPQYTALRERAPVRPRYMRADRRLVTGTMRMRQGVRGLGDPDRPVADAGHDVNCPAEGLDIAADSVHLGHLAVLDLRDAGL
jgi:hypothetical protein